MLKILDHIQVIIILFLNNQYFHIIYKNYFSRMYVYLQNHLILNFKIYFMIHYLIIILHAIILIFLKNLKMNLFHLQYLINVIYVSFYLNLKVLLSQKLLMYYIMYLIMFLFIIIYEMLYLLMMLNDYFNVSLKMMNFLLIQFLNFFYFIILINI